MQLYAITDRAIFAGNERQRRESLCRQVAAWMAAGVDWVQIREKDLDGEELRSVVQELFASLSGLRSAAGGTSAGPGERPRTRVVVNGLEPGLARSLGADGVHLPGGAGAEQIRAARSVGALVSVSCHTLEEVEMARSAGADAILWAPVFGKTVRGDSEDTVLPGTGPAALRQACAVASPMAVFALGGITPANAGVCREAGAAGVAGIRLFHGTGWQQLATRP